MSGGSLSLNTGNLEDIVDLAFHDDEPKRYIPVSSAHVSGVNYLNIGEPGLEFLKGLHDSGLKFTVRTTINPGCFDFEDPKWQRCNPALIEKQRMIAGTLEEMGALVTLSCTPYMDTVVPQPGDHLAWAESSAVLYANSVMGAWSNKESGISAIASAVLGRTAYVGVHKPEGRVPHYSISYDGSISNEVQAGALGFAIGSVVGDSVSKFRCQELSNATYVRQFLAALGTSGSAPMIIIEGITPGCEIEDERGVEMIRLADEDVQRVVEKMSSDKEPEAFVLGCPHLTGDELFDVMRRSPQMRDIPTYAFTSRASSSVMNLSKLSGQLKLIRDSCVLWCGLKASGYKTVATNSVKAAYYLKTTFGLDVKLVSLMVEKT